MNFASPYIELPETYCKTNLEVYARLYGVKNLIKEQPK